MKKLNQTFIIIFFTAIMQAQPQMPQWIVPPYFLDFSSGSITTTTIPNFTSVSKSANAVFDNAGVPLFWVIDDFVYDKNGDALIDPLWNNGGEVAILRVPKSCNRYYIIYQSTGGFAQPVTLYYSIVQLDGSNMVSFVSNNVNFGSGPQEFSTIAVSRMANNEKRYLYFGGFNAVTKYEINPSGISFVNTVFNNMDLNAYGTEMDLSHIGNRLAIAGNDQLFVLTLNSNGDYQSHLEYTLPGDLMAGVEFNQTGDQLFVSVRDNDGPINPAIDGIYVIDLTNQSNNYALIPATSNLRASALELGYNNILYAISQANELYSIDPLSLSVTANVSSNTLQNYASLPDQVDGQEYAFSIGSADLMVADNTSDIGNEPNNGSMSIWEGSVWNCKNDPTCMTNQPPVFQSVDNYMRVKVKNIGCNTSLPATMHLYWTIARTDELWDEHWVNIPSNVIGGQHAGDEITTALTIPALSPGQETTLTQAWNPPNPDLFGLGPNPMICYLARIASPEDLMYNEQLGPVAPNVKNNNNIATRNSTLVKLSQNSNDWEQRSIVVNNPLDEPISVNLRLNENQAASTDPFSRVGGLRLNFDHALDEKISTGEIIIDGASQDRETGVFNAGEKVDGISIRNIVVPPREQYWIGFEFLLQETAVIFDTSLYSYTLSREVASSKMEGTNMVFYLEVTPRAKSNCLWLYLVGGAVFIMVAGFFIFRSRK